MIRILFKQALDEKSFRDGRRITLKEVSEKKGLSGPTLAKISNLPGYNTNTDTISALFDYFEIEPFTITNGSCNTYTGTCCSS